MPRAQHGKRARNAVIVCVIAGIWLALDQATKRIFEGAEVGETLAGPYFGLFDVTLVHNTGGAWGMLSDMTIALAVFSLAICVLAIVYLFVLAPDSSVLAAIGVALVVAGGIGNVIDRLSLSYVIDFIRPLFIDFPVFNVADIGVTLGSAIFMLALILEWRRASESPERAADASAPAAADRGSDTSKSSLMEQHRSDEESSNG